MTDTVDRATRSRIMARIRSKDTEPELMLRRALHRRGLRFRLHAPELPGRPDVVFRRCRVAVFVDGEFWHGRGKLPKTRPGWWRRKLDRNAERDREANARLLALGWTVVRFGDPLLRDGAGADAAALLVQTILKPRRGGLRFALWLCGAHARVLEPRGSGA